MTHMRLHSLARPAALLAVLTIAVAAAHPFGVGDARYRYTETAGAVDTVPFGAYKRELVDKIGLYDETLLSNEDYEFNVRLRQAGANAEKPAALARRLAAESGWPKNEVYELLKHLRADD